MNESNNDGGATLTFNTPSQLGRQAERLRDSTTQRRLGSCTRCRGSAQGNYSNPLKALASDWQINGMFAAFSGNLHHHRRQRRIHQYADNQQTADLVGSYTITDKIGARAWFDTTQFKQPTGVRFGNTERNQFYGPGGNSLDLSVFRVFPLGGTRRLEARLEAGNIFNNNVYANPQASVTSGTFGQITGIAGGTALTNAAYVERSVRLGIRFSF
jgi:hypothetical protein